MFVAISTLAVQQIRASILTHSMLALLLVFCALAARAIVPQGYMVSSTPLTMSVTVCFDGINHQTVDITIPVDKDTGSDDGAGNDHCAFSSLSMASLGGTDGPLLLAALLFLLALGFLPVAPIRLDRRSHVVPPLRGPPALR